MPPSKLACQTLATAYKIGGEFAERLRDVRDAVMRIVTLKTQIRYGIIDIADAIGAEVILAIGAISSQMAENIMGSISKIASSMMERIFSLILKILLAFPTSIFSLVAIPHDAALKSGRRENIYLLRAEKNLKMILYIILKWTDGKSGSDYYKQMMEALPYIINAIKLSDTLISGLDGELVKPGESNNNSVFKEDVYKRIRGNLNTAINISRPTSLIVNLTQINSRLEKDRNSRYRKKAEVINAEYGRRRGDISEWYRVEIRDNTPNSGDSASARLVDAIKEQKVRVLYSDKIDSLNAWKKRKLAVAELEAESEAMINKDTWINAIADTKSRFILDMRTLGDELYSMLGNIKDAYVQNKATQLYCNNIYDMRNIIARIVNELISYMRNIGNAAGTVLSSAIEEAQSLMEVARDTYTKATTSTDKSASSLASSLVVGHGTLLASDAILNSVVTDSLIKLINSDDVLQTENDEFDEFIGRLASIPDWDDKPNVWSVEMLKGSVSPYIQLIADITEMMMKVPVLSVMNNESDKRRVQSLIKGVKKDFRVLRVHNNVVGRVLSSYTPYMGSEAGNLMKILSSAGLLNSFATTMSISSLAIEVASNFTDYFGTESPNYENCNNSYPELFENPSILKGKTNKKLNMPDPRLQNDFQLKLEEKDMDRQINEVRDFAANTNYSRIGDAEEGNTLGTNV